MLSEYASADFARLRDLLSSVLPKYLIRNPQIFRISREEQQNWDFLPL